jgi:DNA-binding MarR family transcriptional regulator
MAYFERFVAFSLLNEEIAKSMQKIRASYMSRFGLRSGDAICLAMLDRHPDGLSAAALAKACKVDRAVISRTLPLLMKEGMIRYQDPAERKHGYRTLLFLTEKGETVVKEMRAFAVETVRYASDSLSGDELAAFYHALRTIEHNLAAYAEQLEADTDGDMSSK